MAFGKQKKDDAGLDVLTDIKEPFSLANFFDEHVVERAKAVKRFLEEKGILFFLLSPFQQRNRLIAQLAVIVLGVLLGVVPRAMHLVEEAKERNASSEMAALTEADTQLAVGSITIRPLASSQYEKQHLLAFYVSGNGGGAVPSTAERYQVDLAAARGVTDVESVAYAYEVIPVSEEGRILLVYTDNREQNDNTGIYHLSIYAADDSLSPEEKSPMEIVLSNTQETNQLFDGDGVDLAVLTEGVLHDKNTPIASAWETFESAIHDYELETERIAGLPLGMTAVPGADELHAFAKDAMFYEPLTDASTTKDITGLSEVPEESMNQDLSYPAAIEMGGVLYDAAYFEAKRGQEGAMPDTGMVPEGPVPDGAQTPDAGVSGDPPDMGTGQEEAEEEVQRQLESLQGSVNKVLQALNGLNAACRTKFETLKGYKLALNQDIDVAAFPCTGHGKAILP